MRRFALLSLLLCAATTLAGDELCGTSEANDARVRAMHERPVARDRFASHATTPRAVLREGAFYVQTDDTITPGHHTFDLEGQSLVFAPRANARYAVTRVASQYVEPVSAPAHNFEANKTGAQWQFIPYDLQNFAMPMFGKNVTRVYLSAFNGIHLAPPPEIAAHQFDAAEAAVHRDGIASPLLITTRKPTRLHYPAVYIDDGADALRVTFRSSTGEAFGYDVQAELRRDGTIVYSYKSMRAMRWGTPILSAGFDPRAAAERVLGGSADAGNDVTTVTDPVLAPMLDLRLVEVVRVDESELFAVRIKLGAPLDLSKLGTNTLRYRVSVGNAGADLDVSSSGYTLVSFTGIRAAAGGPTAFLEGDTIRIYGAQADVGSTDGSFNYTVATFLRPSTRAADALARNTRFDTLTPRRIASNLSSASNTELPLPITEPFTLGVFDPYTVWSKLQQEYALSDWAIDGVLMYQTFFTDIIFYAGAYATGGNPQVEGIYATNQFIGPLAPREPSLMHMNQLGYGYNVLTENASRVMLHEFGHRWLYFFNIREGNQTTRSLNPLSAHPAGYVHTPAAFNVFTSEDASVMGGGFFTNNGDGTYKARATNYAYSWTDLYLMGLASKSEVTPWFYLANTNPPLAQEYWPIDNAVVTGEQRNVSVDQIIAVHGDRSPSAAMSQKGFRVVFVLVTENGAAPTDEEVAKLNYWRSVLERDFSTATGGRGRVQTGWVEPAKKRPVR